MKLNINLERYNECAKEAINDFETQCINEAQHVDKDVQENVKLMIEALDKFMNIVDLEEKRENKAYCMAAEALMMTLLHEKVDEYAEKIPNMIKDILQEIIEKM